MPAGRALGCVPDQAQREPGHRLGRGVAGEAEVAAVGIVNDLMRPGSAEGRPWRRRGGEARDEIRVPPQGPGQEPGPRLPAGQPSVGQGGACRGDQQRPVLQGPGRVGDQDRMGLGQRSPRPEADSTPTGATRRGLSVQDHARGHPAPIWRRVQVGDCTWILSMSSSRRPWAGNSPHASVHHQRRILR